MYYEIHGTGRPLILLTVLHVGNRLSALAENRQVIAVDLQGHGRTADMERPLPSRKWRTTWRLF